MKNQEKGITLIALIITIIVMLILVSVTINVALNGGLFGKAEEAKIQTNIAKDKEVLQTKALGYLDDDGYVDLAEFVSRETPLEGYTLSNNTTYVTASNGTNTFYITMQGGITETEPLVNQGYYIYLEKDNMNFYKVGNLIYFNLDNNWYYSEIYEEGTIRNNGASAIEEKLGISNISPDTPTYCAIGSFTIIKINDDWYYYKKDPWSFQKFELIEFDTSVFETATEFGGM